MNQIRVWKDPDYRAGLSEAELAKVPANPAGPIKLSNADLDAVGGYTTWLCATVATVTMTVTACSGTGKFGTIGCC